MSKKHLLTNLLALLCLANGRIEAKETSNVKSTLPPPQKIAKSVSNTDKFENKTKDKMETKGNILTNPLFVGPASFLTGGALGGMIGGWVGNSYGKKSLESELQAKNQTINDLNTKVKDLEKKVTDGNENDALKKKIAELEAEKLNLAAQLSTANTNLQTEKSKVNDLESQINVLKANNKDEQVKKLLKQVDELVVKNANLTKEKNQFEQDYKIVKADAEHIRAAIFKVAPEAGNSFEELHEYSAYLNHVLILGKILNNAMKESKKTNENEIFGTYKDEKKISRTLCYYCDWEGWNNLEDEITKEKDKAVEVSCGGGSHVKVPVDSLFEFGIPKSDTLSGDNAAQIIKGLISSDDFGKVTKRDRNFIAFLNFAIKISKALREEFQKEDI